LDYVWWTVKDWEGCDLFEGKIPASAWNDWGKLNSACQNSQCPTQNSNWVPPN
jgi:hypothetical protein